MNFLTITDNLGILQSCTLVLWRMLLFSEYW